MTPQCTLRRIATSCVALFGSATLLMANHPVFVEGDADFDLDGRIGAAEDADTDTTGFPIFGTIREALAAQLSGGNQNARVVIVTSGRFREAVNITGIGTNIAGASLPPGNVSLEAAPGVEAIIDAVASGDTAGNNARQIVPGVIVNTPATSHVTLRNLVIRNWSEGVQVVGDSRVLIDNCRIEQNLNYGVHVLGNAKVLIDHSKISSTGFRFNPGVGNVPDPGTGVEFEEASSGLVSDTTVVSSKAFGINNTARRSAVRIKNVTLFDNETDLGRIRRSAPIFTGSSQ